MSKQPSKLAERPSGQIETTLGTIVYRMDSADHVFLRVPEGTTVTIHRVEYYLSYSMGRVDGRWQKTDWRSLNLYRPGDGGDASRAATGKAEEILTAAWIEFINAHPGLLLKAERARLMRECKDLADKLVDAEAEVARLEGLIDANADVLESVLEKIEHIEDMERADHGCIASDAANARGAHVEEVIDEENTWEVSPAAADAELTRAMQRFNREQLIWIVEVALDAALSTASDNAGNHATINGSIEAAGLLLSFLYARLTGDGMGACDTIEVSSFDDLVWEYMGLKMDNPPLPSCRPTAERFVDAVFGDYLKGAE